MRAVDTNVLVRALVRDDPIQAARAEALMQAGEVFVPVTVVLELEWVLRSRYGFAPQQVARAMEMLAGLPRVNLHEADAVRVAARRAAKGWDFAYALHHALSAGCDSFSTFDENLVRRAGRMRQEVLPRVARV